MSRGDAHFLHEKAPLEAVLCAPLERPRALTWVGRQSKLIVATAEGELHEVDPIFGTRKLGGMVRDPAALSSSYSGKRIVVVERGHGVGLHKASGERRAFVKLPLLSDISVAWFTRAGGKAGVAVVGQTLDGRRGLVLDADFANHKMVKLPDQTVLGPGQQGRLVAARCNTDGLTVAPFGKGLRRGECTHHRLRFASGVLIGIADGGVTVWRSRSRVTTVKGYETTAAALSEDRSVIAIGTREGDVGFCALDDGTVKRAKPPKVGGHESAVRQLFFARRGRWLASVGEELWLWRY
jgi:hypothetical protein